MPKPQLSLIFISEWAISFPVYIFQNPSNCTATQGDPREDASLQDIARLILSSEVRITKFSVYWTSLVVDPTSNYSPQIQIDFESDVKGGSKYKYI
jgi:hypothetical protein